MSTLFWLVLLLGGTSALAWYPVTCKDAAYEIVQGLDIDDFSRGRMDATEAELREERDGVADLL